MSTNLDVSTIIYKDKFIGLKESKIFNQNVRMLDFNIDIAHNLVDHNLINNSSIYFFLDNDKFHIGVGKKLNSIIENKNIKKSTRIIMFIIENNNINENSLNYLKLHYINKFRTKTDSGYDYLNINFSHISHIEKNRINLIIQNIDNLLEMIDLDKYNLPNNKINNSRSTDILKTIGCEKIIKNNYNLLDKPFVKMAINKVLPKINYSNVKRFILERLTTSITQAELELKIFGFDSHGNITRAIKYILDVDFKTLKKAKLSRNEMINKIETYDEKIRNFIEIINEKFK